MEIYAQLPKFHAQRRGGSVAKKIPSQRPYTVFPWSGGIDSHNDSSRKICKRDVSQRDVISEASKSKVQDFESKAWILPVSPTSSVTRGLLE